MAGSVAVLNIVVFVWAVASHPLDPRGVGTMYTGSCDTTRVANGVAHVAINGLSALFLTSGNYCMQILTTPTRADLDAAHAVGGWLEIGVPSIANLCRFQRRRVFLWLSLGLISTLLHLVYVLRLNNNTSALGH